MKHKFSSMGRVAIALVLALSLSLVMAVPASAEGETITYGEYTFQNDAPGTGDWSADEAHSGSYSALLSDGGRVGSATGAGRVIVGGEDGADEAPLNIPLADITGLSFWFNYNNPGISPDYIPALSLHIDSGGGETQDFVACVTMTAGDIEYGDVFEEDVWQEWTLDTAVTTVYGTGPVWHGTAGEGKTFADVKAAAGEDAVVLHIMIGEGGWCGSYEPYEPSTAYIDDISIETTIATVVETTTYDLEPPIFLDDSFYQVDETVTVTVFDADETGTVSVYVGSSIHPLMGPVALTETSAENGMFVGTFTLVDTTPGPGDLLVGDADTVTVGYPDLEQLVTTAIVDNTLPVVAITSHEDGDFVTGDSVVIDWTIDEINEDALSVTIGGEVVEEGELSYTWDTTELDDGAYTIEVIATDKAGNSSSDSIDVTVDNTPPVIEDQEATPPVILPDDETAVVFTATVTDVNVDTVTIDLSPVGGTADLAMLDDGEGDDATADDGIYTASENITESDELDYDLTVTATDEATNSDTAVITLGVWLDIVNPVITDPAITYEYGSSAQPGDLVTIFATAIDDVLMDTVTAECDAVDGTINLLDGGSAPDVEAGDGIYTATATVDETAGWGDYTVTITAEDNKGNAAIDESLTLAVRTGATGIDIVLDAGWNLISLPLIPGDDDISVVISADTLASGDVSSVGIVRGYDLATEEFPAYIPGTGGELATMEDGVGYWVFMEEVDTLTITGTQWPAPPEVPPTYDVVVGWNLIGFKSIEDMPDYFLNIEGELLVEGGYLANIAGTYPVLWSYDAFEGAYYNVKGVVMEVGHGFWIWINEPGTIVPPGPLPPPEE